MSLLVPLMIGSAIAGLTGTGINMWENHKNRQFNSAEAEKQRNWEQEMSNTAYQRSMEDMKQAGLNPAMMYASGGAGMSSTPSGANASAGAPMQMNLVGQVGQLMNSITSARALDMQRGRKSNDHTMNQMYRDTAELLDMIANVNKMK